MLPTPLRRAQVLFTVLSMLGCFAYILLLVTFPMDREVVTGARPAEVAVGVLSLAFCIGASKGLDRAQPWGYWSGVAAVGCLLPQALVSTDSWALAALIDLVLARWLIKGRAFVTDVRQ